MTHLTNNISAGGISASGYGGSSHGGMAIPNGSVNDSGNKLDSVFAHWDYGNPGRIVKKRPPNNRINSSRSSGRDRSSKNSTHRFANSKIPFHKKADAVDELAWTFGQADMMLDGIIGGSAGTGGSAPGQHPHHQFLHHLDERLHTEGGGPASIQAHCMPSPASVNPVTPLSVSNAMTPKHSGPGSVPPPSAASQSARTPGDPSSLRSPYPTPTSNGPLTPLTGDMDNKLGPTTPKSVGGPPSCGPPIPPMGSPFGARSKGIVSVALGPPSAGTIGGERKFESNSIKTEPVSATNPPQPNLPTITNGVTVGSSNNTNTHNSNSIGTAQVTTNMFNLFFKCDSDAGSGVRNQGGDLRTGTLSYKRPALPYKEYEVELKKTQVTLSDHIYDSGSMHDWLNHPIKKYRRSADSVSRNQKSGSVASSNDPPKRPMYRRKSQSDMLQVAMGLPFLNGSGAGVDTTVVKMETEHSFNGGGLTELTSVSCKREKCRTDYSATTGITSVADSHDPYDSDPRKDATKALLEEQDLYTEAGIKPSMHDLDNMFESDDSGDGNGAGPTPPSSVPNAGIGSIINHDGAVNQNDMVMTTDSIISATKIKGLPALTQQQLPTGTATKIDPTGNLPHDQLSKMFPTPPSHEHNPIASPADGEMGVGDHAQMGIHTAVGTGNVNIKLEQPASPMTDLMLMDVSSGVNAIEDAAMMLSSAKFAPLQKLFSDDLPSLVLRPCLLKYKPIGHNQALNNSGIHDGATHDQGGGFASHHHLHHGARAC